jgi:hypothetical protein
VKTWPAVKAGNERPERGKWGEEEEALNSRRGRSCTYAPSGGYE